MSRSLRALRVAVILVVAVAASGLTSASAGSDRYTPVVMDVIGPPHWFRGSDAQFKLVYELKLSNGFPIPIEIGALTVKDGKGRAVERLAGDELLASTSPLADPREPSLSVAASGSSVVWLEISFGSRQQIPAVVEHTLTVRVPPGLPTRETNSHTGARVRVDLRPPVVLGPPLRGRGWIAAGSCCNGPHRRALQPVNGGLKLGQRFAVDWNGSNATHRLVVGDPTVNENWVFFDKPVIAVANGTVVVAVDRWPDQIPTQPKPVGLAQADGNHVIIKIGKRRYAAYAHLVPGSLAVEVGDRVKKGELIGRLGNSGSSSGPHLHFQVMSAPSMVDAEGLPFVIDSFRKVGAVPPFDQQLEELVNAGNPIPIDPVGAGRRHDELPLGDDVVNFPDGQVGQ